MKRLAALLVLLSVAASFSCDNSVSEPESPSFQQGPPPGKGPPSGKGPPPGKGPPFFRKIAFTSTRDGNNEVYVMNAEGTGQTNLTNNAALDLDIRWR